MNILITGAKGFIGKHLVKRLSKNHNVTEHEWGDQLPDLWHYKAVIHTGAISSTTYRDVEQILKQNYEYTKDLIQKATEVGCMIQYSSSASVYGPTDHFTEDGPLLPQSPYAWSKYLVDRWVNSKFFGAAVQGFRYFNVYGEKQNIGGAYASVIGIFSHQRLNGKPMTIRGDGEQKRDFNYVGDVVNANILASQSEQVGTGEVINIGNGDNRSINQIADMIGGDRINVEPVIEPRESLADNSLAKELLGWEPTQIIEDWIPIYKKDLGLN